MTGKWHLGDNAPHRPQDEGLRCGMASLRRVGQASDHWGNDYFVIMNGSVRAAVRNLWGNGYCTDVWFREGMRFITDNKNNPFFLYIATNAPHGPYRVDPKWATPYKRM